MKNLRYIICPLWRQTRAREREKVYSKVWKWPAFYLFSALILSLPCFCSSSFYDASQKFFPSKQQLHKTRKERTIISTVQTDISTVHINIYTTLFLTHWSRNMRKRAKLGMSSNMIFALSYYYNKSHAMRVEKEC